MSPPEPLQQGTETKNSLQFTHLQVITSSLAKFALPAKDAISEDANISQLEISSAHLSDLKLLVI